jgi:hypothetical protein
MGQCIEYWQENAGTTNATANNATATATDTIWRRIGRHKVPIIEPRGSEGAKVFKERIEEFKTLTTGGAGTGNSSGSSAGGMFGGGSGGGFKKLRPAFGGPGGSGKGKGADSDKKKDAFVSYKKPKGFRDTGWGNVCGSSSNGGGGGGAAGGFQDSGNGAVLFAVCRGKVSEGVDFADDMGRAVVVTGLPFAPPFDPKIRLKREYLDEQSRKFKGTGMGSNGRLTTNSSTVRLTGQDWYLQQALRAVNQAIGRVIRHSKDYGAILFLDERFGNQQNSAKLSKWLRPSLKICSNFGQASGGLTKFFKAVGRNTRLQLARELKRTAHLKGGDALGRDAANADAQAKRRNARGGAFTISSSSNSNNSGGSRRSSSSSSGSGSGREEFDRVAVFSPG